MPGEREKLIQEAKAKHAKEQLVAEAKAKWAAENEPKDNTDLLDKVETGARSFIGGATVDLSEPVFSGINAVAGATGDKIMDLVDTVRGVPQESNKPGFVDNVKKGYTDDVERRRRLRAELPTLDTVARVGGAIAPVIATMGASAPLAEASIGKTALSVLGSGGKIASTGGKLARGFVEALPGVESLAKLKGVGNLISAPVRVGLGAVEGAGQVAASEAVRRTTGNLTGFRKPEDNEPSIGEMIQSGAMFSGALSAIPEAGKLAAATGKKAMSVVLGPKTEAITKFLKAADRLTGKTYKEELVKTKDSVQKAVDDLAGEAGRSSLDAADEIQVALNGLKQKVGEASAASREILEQENVTVPKAQLVNLFDSAMGQIKTVGGKVIGKSTKEAMERLKSLRDEFAGVEVDEISGTELKNVLQILDDEFTELQNAGQFDSVYGRLVKNVRRGFDGLVKGQSENYQKQMAETKRLVDLLETSSRKFGTQEKALAALKHYGTGKSPVFDPVLQGVSDEMGLAPTLDKVRQVRDASQAFNSFKGAGTENALKSLMNDKTIEIRRKFQKLSELSEQDFTQMADDLGLLKQFEGEFRIGSRNVNFWTVMAGAAGGFFGGPTGAILTAPVGAAVGSTIDKFGPMMAKKVLEGYARIQGTPTLQKIEQAFHDLPPAVVQDLKTDFIRAVSASKQGTPVMIPKSQREVTRRDIMDSKLSNTEKAKLMNKLNRSGTVDEDSYSQVLIGNPPEQTPAQNFLQGK